MSLFLFLSLCFSLSLCLFLPPSLPSPPLIVRSHGTEGRPAVKPVQPRSEVYEYIIFRGSDIKDLSVNEVAKSSEEPQDPAILSTVSYSN